MYSLMLARAVKHATFLELSLSETSKVTNIQRNILLCCQRESLAKEVNGALCIVIIELQSYKNVFFLPHKNRQA